MSHLSYNEFKNRFGDLGITKYTKAMWLEEGCEEIGKYVVGTVTTIETLSTSTGYVKRMIVASLDNLDTEGLRKTKGLYSQNFSTVSDGRTFNNTKPYDIYTNEQNVVYTQLPGDWTDEQCIVYMKGKIILYKIKTEGQLGMIMNASGELQSGSGSVGSFKYEVTGGHTYDVVNAKAATSSYVKWLDANGNQIGSVTQLTSTNYPKQGDTRPMSMPSNCKYVWLLMPSANVDLPIALIQ